MAPATPEFSPHSLEAEASALWKARHLPPPGGTLGPANGPTVRQFLGNWTQGDFPGLVAHRAVTADVSARYLALSGRRVSGTLRQGASTRSLPPINVPSLLSSLGIWVGGDGRSPWDAEERPAQIQEMVGRLAAKGVFVTRDEAFRVCPSCGTLRSPERTIYDEQEGDTYLVRFPIRIGDRTVHALVWVDVPWKLLGASALLVNPNLRYVVAEYRFRETRELVLTSRTSLERLRQWIPEAVLEVLEERTGKEFQGLPYTYPLRHEFPMGGDLTAPGGTILGAADVGDSGTGIVPLVPGHGPTDARIADRLGVSGWPLLTPKGRFDFTLMHKYAGLDLETANEFVLRDLSEAGALLAHLRVKRGVPYCALCGTSLLWVPARAWCLEPAHLPPDLRTTFARLLPKESFPGSSEVAPWPVSEAATSEDAKAVALLECKRCERLDAPDGPKQCVCGGQRSLVRRKLLPSIGSTLAAWARVDPFPEGDSVHIYLGQRRRVAAFVHHLVAMCGVEVTAADVALTVVPTVGAADVADLVRDYGADAVRAAVVRGGLSESAGNRFVDQCRRESDRLRRFVAIARRTAAQCDPSMVAEFARPIEGFLGELETEDRAIVARWERARLMVLAHYDHSAPGLAHRRATHFLDNDLVDYRELIAPRLALSGVPPTKRAALRTLAYLVRSLSVVLAPIVPFTAEAVHRSLSPDRASLFERTIPGPDRALQNDDLVAAWDRWRTVLRSVARFRRSIGVDRAKLLPLLVLSLPADDVADRLRSETAVLARLAGVARIEVGSPRDPWKGRQRVMRPVEAEVQKVYPTQAKQVIHLLQRLPPRRATDASGEEELSVVIDGYPVRIYPAMISVEETLPKHVVPAPWPLGEMYLEVPTDARVGRPSFPPLSPDAFWLVRRLEHRLRSFPPAPDQPPRVAIVTVKEPLSSELRASAGPTAQALGLGELRVVDKVEEAIPPTAVTGRTRTGDRWWVHLPGLPAPPPRPRKVRPGARLPRVTSPPPSAPTEEVDYANEQVVAREESVRALGQELDAIVGLPLLGPSKVAAAWDLGLRSVEDLRLASFDVLSALPGFGSPVAEVVIEKIGGVPPPRRPRVRQRREAPPKIPALSVAVTLRSSGPDLTLAPSPRVAPPPARPPEPIPLPAAPVSMPPPSPEPEAPSEPRPPTVPEEAAIPTPPVTAEPVEPSEGPVPAPAEPIPSVEAPVGTFEAEPPNPLPSPGEPLTAEVVPEPPPPSPETLPATVASGGEISSAEPIVEPEGEANLPPEPAASEPEPLAPVMTLEAPSPEPALPTEEAPNVESPTTETEEVTPVPIEETATLEPEAPPATISPIEPVVSEVASPETPTTVPELVPSERPPGPGTEPSLETPPAPEAEEAPPPTEPATAPPEVTVEPESPVAPETSPEVPPVSSESPPAETLTPTTEVTEPILPTGPVEPPAPELPTESTVSPPVLAPPAPPTLVPPPAPVSLPPEPEPPLPPTGVELTIGDSLFVALGGFLDSTAAGHRGVCVVRESPERIRTRFGPRPIEVYWLSNIGRGPSIRPADLEGLWTVLGRKLAEEHATAFFLEGMEYLIRMHGADAVLTGLVQFDRLAREHDARVWVCLTPALMKPYDLERFRSTFGPSPSS